MPTVDAHFVKRAPVVREIYDRLVKTARVWGDVREEPKKTSIHLARTTAFAGIATKKDALVLTLKSASDIRSRRVIKREQASAHRWHLEVRLERPSDVDAEIKTWMRQAYEIS
jgi:uncharacterized protein DUF5655